MPQLAAQAVHPTLSTSSLVLFIILLGTTVTYAVLYFRAPGLNVDKIGERIRYLWTFYIIFLLALSTTHRLLIPYVAFLSFLGLKEYLSITPTRRADRRVLFLAYLAIPIQTFFIWIDWYAAFIAFVPAYLLLFIPLCMVIIGETDGFLNAISIISWGLVTMVYGLGHLAYLLLLQSPVTNEVGGIGLFLFVVVLSQISHVAQYVFGKMFTHPRWQFKVTRTRNWASLFGSIVASMLIAWLTANYLTALNPLQSILAGAVVATASFVGYVTMTAIKTDLQIKDRGTMTPGHGGVMNRIDTVIYSAPVFFHLVRYLAS